MTKQNNQKQVKRIIKKQATRVGITRKSHLWFFHTYLSDHVQYPIADLHKEMFAITEDDKIKLAAICSFRGSGKSTLMSLSYPIWSVIGRPRKRFIVLISQTAEQAKMHFKNLKRELETNELLIRDLGPFRETHDEWNTCGLIIKNYDAKIVAVSKEQSFRGIRYGRYRPDLIICDDLENSDSVKTQESRDSTYNWFTGEVLPLGDKNTKIVMVSNLLHQDSLVMRLKNEMESGRRSGIFRQYPLIDEDHNNRIAWPGKYPDQASVEEEKRKIGNIYSWCREYLLRVIDERAPVVYPDWIQYYNELPTVLRGQSACYATGVDLAISQKDGADYTAMVSAFVLGSGENKEIYILPNPVNRHMGLSQITDAAIDIYKSHGDRYSNTFYVEDIMLQGHIISVLKEKGISAIGVPIYGKDKRIRLEIAGVKIHAKRIFFPRHGCEELLNQILNFGVTKHDDLVDAFTTLAIGLEENEPNQPEVLFLNGNPLTTGSFLDEDWADQEDREMFG